MDAQRWRKLQDLFAEARAVEGEERGRLLQEHARIDPELVDQVQSLLVADSEAGIMDALRGRLGSVSQLLTDSAPERIGAYRIIRELGRGGMGTVYLAERADGQFEQRVAIKLIATTDSGDPLHQRFLAERQILAGLVHPNIARLLDGGVTEDGRPYLVLEYVDGLPITAYCDQHRLDIQARLRLFGDVCAAVQHAHQNLVIHRDLKPTNILVSSDGRVHLLDFGIAKLIDPAVIAAPVTRLELRAMTPEYASPEQVRGDSLTTASDIYSLGVLLYELLTGCAPYRLSTGSAVEMAAAICDQDPERPSARGTRMARQLEGDLDSIVLMAMRKEPGRRYASADVLRQDIERHLSGLPVLAHRGSGRYRIEKFVRRHRVEAAAAAIVFAALLAGLSIAVAQSRRASRERDRAEQALAESEGVTNFLMELFQTGDPEGGTPATQLSALDLLQRGAARANELSNQPIVRARLLDAIGQMSLHLGQYGNAQQLLEEAVTIRRAQLGPQSPELATSLIHLARVHRARDEHDRAGVLVAEALEIRRGALAPNDPGIAEALYELGWVTTGPAQERLYREALGMLPDAGAAAAQRVTLLQALSTNLRRQGRLAEAVVADRDALRSAERAFGPEHAVAGYAMIHLADHVRDIEQDFEEAERLYRRGLELIERQYGDNSIRLIHGLHSLGTLMTRQGDREAEQLFRRGLAIRSAATGPEHPQMAEGLELLAIELARQQRLQEAEALARQALELSRRTLGERHPTVLNARLPLLAEVLSQQGNHVEAERTYRMALSLADPGPIISGEMRRSFGLMLLRQGKYTAAQVQLLQSLALLEEASYGGGNHPNAQETKRALMELYRQWSKPALVERYRVPPGRFIPY